MKALVPALVFLIVAGLGVAAALVWQRRYGERSRAIARQIAAAEALRQPREAHGIRQDVVAQSALFEWIEDRLAVFPAIKLLLIRADSNKNPAEFALISLGMALAGVLFATLALRAGLIGTLVTTALFAVFPWWRLTGKAKKRRLKFEDQLPDALDFISRSLRAGHGLTASMGMAGNELADPVGRELRITFDEINFGIAFKEAMANLMARVNSPDLGFFAVAVVIQRETGGNLTELLANLSNLIRERIKLKGKVRVLASEGRFSGILLGGLPFLLAGLLSVINPDYMGMLWKTPQGHKLVLTGLGMMVVGAFLMHRIVQIKV